jgi:hypothetical protein
MKILNKLFSARNETCIYSKIHSVMTACNVYKKVRDFWLNFPVGIILALE